MASFNLTDISSALSEMKDVGVSFVGKALKFNNAADGEFYCNFLSNGLK
jgi:hypothetical protein